MATAWNMSFENDEKSYKNVKMNKIKFEQIIPVHCSASRKEDKSTCGK